MQALAVFGVLLLLLATIPFTGSTDNQFRQHEDAISEASANQMQEFARSAWAARTDVAGMMDRGAMILPSGFADVVGRPYQARIDGDFLYVWNASPAPEDRRVELVFPEGDETVDVGLVSGSSINFRDGEVASRPAWLPASNNPNQPYLVVRLRK
jgi:hypothetical protein